jgi:hypothetical protein
VREDKSRGKEYGSEDFQWQGTTASAWRTLCSAS